jgi:hypothetical protein
MKKYEKYINTNYFSLSLPFRSGVRMILICNIFPYSIKREEEKREKEKKEKE